MLYFCQTITLYIPKLILGALIIGLSMVSTQVWANTKIKTSELVASHLHQTACRACHAAMVGGDGRHLYQRANRIVASYQSLLERVIYCSQGAQNNWQAHQLQAVADYLNQNYYRFPEPPKP